MTNDLGTPLSCPVSDTTRGSPVLEDRPAGLLLLDRTTDPPSIRIAKQDSWGPPTSGGGAEPRGAVAAPAYLRDSGLHGARSSSTAPVQLLLEHPRIRVHVVPEDLNVPLETFVALRAFAEARAAAPPAPPFHPVSSLLLSEWAEGLVSDETVTARRAEWADHITACETCSQVIAHYEGLARARRG